MSEIEVQVANTRAFAEGDYVSIGGSDFHRVTKIEGGTMTLGKRLRWWTRLWLWVRNLRARLYLRLLAIQSQRHTE